MSATIAAVVDMLRTNAGELREAVKGLTTSQLDHTPAPDTSSIAVLTAHAVTATRALTAAALTGSMDFLRYRAEEREPAFETHGADEAHLLGMIDQLDRAIDRVEREGAAIDLGGLVEYPGTDRPPVLRAWALIHALEHLREHVGHAQLTRQLLG